MQIIRGLHNLRKKISQGCVATIGNFDGMHLGHQQLLSLVQEKSRALGLPAVVILFEPQPEEYFTGVSSRDLIAGSNKHVRLTRIREKLILLTVYKIDNVLLLPFNKKLANMSARQFISEILISKLQIRGLVIGDDFVCGKDREGDYTLLQRIGSERGFQVIRMETLRINGKRVSSSLIRDILAEDNFQLAGQFSGRTYQICGRVIHGDGVGHKLGFPTANIYLGKRKVLFNGVYLVKVYGVQSLPCWGLANIGYRPTLNNVNRRKTFEVYILNFNADVYGCKVPIEFYQKMRDEKKFSSPEELRLQITEDIATGSEVIFNLGDK